MQRLWVEIFHLFAFGYRQGGSLSSCYNYTDHLIVQSISDRIVRIICNYLGLSTASGISTRID